jgi:WD40 repeat protein
MHSVTQSNPRQSVLLKQLSIAHINTPAIFKELPDELFERVLSFVPIKEILLVLPLVCKRWKNIVGNEGFIRDYVTRKYLLVFNKSFKISRTLENTAIVCQIIYEDMIFSGCANKDIVIRDHSNLRTICTLKSTDPINCLYAHSKWLYVATRTGAIKRWNLTKWSNSKESFRVDKIFIGDLAADKLFVTDNLLVATQMRRTMNNQAKLKVWDTLTAALIKTISFNVIGNLNVEILDGTGFYPTASCSITRADLRTGNVLKTFEGHGPGFDTYIDKFKVIGNFLVASAFQGSIKIWNITTGELVNTYTSPSTYSGYMDISEGILYCSTLAGKVERWNVVSGQKLIPIGLSRDPIHWMKVEGDLLIAKDTRDIILYDCTKNFILERREQKSSYKHTYTGNRLTVLCGKKRRKIKVMYLTESRGELLPSQVKNPITIRRDSQQPKLKYNVG